MTIFLLTMVALYGPWIAGALFLSSGGLLALVWLEKRKQMRSFYMLLILALLFAELLMTMQLDLGAITNTLVLFWIVFHFWLMGQFER